jgi:hypothetical protein
MMDGRDDRDEEHRMQFWSRKRRGFDGGRVPETFGPAELHGERDSKAPHEQSTATGRSVGPRAGSASVAEPGRLVPYYSDEQGRIHILS